MAPRKVLSRCTCKTMADVRNAARCRSSVRRNLPSPPPLPSALVRACHARQRSASPFHTESKSCCRAEAASVAADCGLELSPSASVALRGEFPHQRHVARAGVPVGPGHRPVAVEVLPPVARAHVSGTRTAHGVTAGVVAGHECEAERSLFGAQRIDAPVADGGRQVPAAGAAEMRRQQDVRAQRLVSREAEREQQHVAHRIGHHPQRQLEPVVAVDDVDHRDAGIGESQTRSVAAASPRPRTPCRRRR